MERSASFSDCRPEANYSEPPQAASTPPIPGGPRLAACVSLIALYLLPGLIGHDPWKQDETYIADIVRTMLDTGNMLVPTMAGEPFMEKPPLYYWVAAACAWLSSPLLPLHDGARLANLVLLGLTCQILARTARLCWKSGNNNAAPLVLLACLGMETHAHLMLTDIAMLPGVALALLGLASCRERPRWGGLLLGTGVGIGFLAKGLFVPGAIGLCAVLLPLWFRQWREPTYLRTLVIALVTALPWLLVWPIEIYLRSPSLFLDWFWLNNVGRFLGFSVPLLGAVHDRHFWLRNLPWFTFPALPLALATLWQRRTSVLADTRLQLPLVLSLVLAAVLALSASARNNYALPLLLPLSLLAAPAVMALPEALDRPWDWAARAVFGCLAALIFAVWASMTLQGSPPNWLLAPSTLPQELAAAPSLAGFVLAAFATLVAVAVGKRLLHGAGRGLCSWVLGLALCWALLSTLLLPSINYAKSYRSVFASIRTALPAEYRCMNSTGLGESERAMLDYYLGIVSWRRETGGPLGCDVLLVNGFRDSPPRDIDAAQWSLIWQGARPGDTRERFWLFSARLLQDMAGRPKTANNKKHVD